MRILFVEDDLFIRMMASEYLMDNGHDVVEATSAKEGLMALSQIPPFDVIVTDVRMPGPMDGLDLAFFARQQYPTVPIIVASGFATNLEPRLREIEPAAVFVEKPYELEVLSAILDRLVNEDRSSR